MRRVFRFVLWGCGLVTFLVGMFFFMVVWAFVTGDVFGPGEPVDEKGVTGVLLMKGSVVVVNKSASPGLEGGPERYVRSRVRGSADQVTAWYRKQLCGDAPVRK